MKRCSMKDSRFFFILTLTLLLTTINCSGQQLSADPSILTVEKNNLNISINSGDSYKGLGSSNLPENIEIEKIFSDASGNIYLATFDSGLWRLKKNSTSWESLKSRELLRRTYEGQGTTYREISALAVNPSDENEITIATRHTIYHSTDSGSSWKELRLDGFDTKGHVTALGYYKKNIVIGTSANGIYIQQNNSAKKISGGLDCEPYSATFNFYDEIAAFSVDNSTGTLYAASAFTGKLYQYNPSEKKWEKIYCDSNKDKLLRTYDLCAANNEVYLGTGAGIKVVKVDKKNNVTQFTQYKIPAKIDSFFLQDYPRKGISLFSKTERNDRLSADSQKGANKKAIYLNIYQATKQIPKSLAIYKKAGINAVVIDMKDDAGNIYFPSNNSDARRIGAIKKPLPVSKIISDLHADGFYAIARFVVFKDSKLFNADNFRYAIKDSRDNGPWRGNNREFWVDPFSSFVRDYNIALAVELAALGFDEIQFDYIRFPTDGPTNFCRFSHAADATTYRSEILYDFLSRANNAIAIPLATDVYGFCGWFRLGNSLGQDMNDFAHAVDIISPMEYPSHYGSRFYKKYTPAELPYYIVYHNGLHAQWLTGNRVILRPYLQSFKLLSPTWGPEYINVQINGAKLSGNNGFIFWNAGGDYSMLLKALTSDKQKKEIVKK